MAANALLAARDGRLLLVSQALTFAAHGIAVVALPWLVLDGHDSTLGAGLVFTFTMLPYVVFGLAAGVVGDRYPSRVVIWIVHGVQAVVALAIPLWSLAGTPPVAAVLVAAFAIGTGRVFSDAAVFGALVAVVGREGVVHGQATLNAAWAVGQFAGPAFGGLLVAGIGPGRALFVEAAGLAVATLVVRAMRLAGDRARHERLPARTIVGDGLRVIFGDAVLRVVTGLGVGWCFVAAGAWALPVVFLREELGLGSGEAGVVLSLGALTGVAAPFVVGRFEPRVGGVGIIAVTTPLAGVAAAAFGVVEGFGPALVTFCAMELTAIVGTAAYIGERQRRAPLELQATVGIFGRMLIMVALTSGSAVASALTAAVPLRSLYVGTGIATLAVCLVGLPLLRRAARTMAAVPATQPS
jgi:hypothetical protein